MSSFPEGRRAGDADICARLDHRVRVGPGSAFSVLAAVTHFLGEVSRPESGWVRGGVSVQLGLMNLILSAIVERAQDARLEDESHTVRVLPVDCLRFGEGTLASYLSQEATYRAARGFRNAHRHLRV